MKEPSQQSNPPQVEYFKDIVAAVREPLLVLDARLRVLAANRSFYKTFKVKQKDTLGQQVYDLGDRQWDIPGLRTLLETILPGKAVFNDYEVEHDFPFIGRRILLLNARRIPASPKEARWILLAFEDVTQRRQVERVLQASEERFRRAFETAHDGMLLIEKTGGMIVNSNQAAEALLGYSKQSLRKKHLWQLGLLQDEGQFRQTALELEAQGTAVLPDVIIPTRAGGHFPADVFLMDKAAVFQCNIRDISERKQAEAQILQLNASLEERVALRTRELQIAQEQLVQKEKLAVLGQLAGGVGHELRNPLGVISNSIFYLKMVQPDADEKIKQYHAMIEQEVHTATRIIGDLLDYARVISTDRRPESVAGLVEHALSRFPVPAAIKVNLVIPADLPQVYADPLQVEQVLGNLITNACQAMENGGELTILSSRKKQMLAISVKDTGTGISPENKEKLFQALFTTKAKGIGLGLAVSQKLAEANGGKIEAESEAGRGSLFTVYLPILGAELDRAVAG